LNVIRSNPPYINRLKNHDLAVLDSFGKSTKASLPSLTSLQLKLIKIGARVVRHARAITFQLAEVAVTGLMVRAILTAICRLRTPPSCA